MERPVIAVDVVLLCVQRSSTLVLLHRRVLEPFAGAMALPGVAVRIDETLHAAALRALCAKAGLPAERLEEIHLEQLATFDALFRDPRGRTISVAHMGLCREPLPAASTARWLEVAPRARGTLPFDHDQILQVTLQRLRGKLRYTNIAAHLVADVFRLEELQNVYEALLERRLNRANFRTKLLKIGLIERVGVSHTPRASGGRPPHLYRFARNQVEPVDRDFV